MTALRNLSGRFQRLPHDPRNPWVLVDSDLREPVLRTSTRAECRYHQRISGGIVVRTQPERRHG